ncbi:MAG: hypothetical protein CR997_02760 [Acidobacteria bacterium]|nr:MAG: hypothetical protein CR997_02760 [Acidobacteriota bacterium]
MKKFKFKLQPVLNVRETRKKIAEKAVSVTQARLNKVDEEVKHIQSLKEQSFFFQKKGTQLGFWMELCENYRTGLKHQESKLLEQKNKLQNRLKVEKKELISKLTDEKVLNTLREAKLNEYLVEAEKEEQKEIEELDILKRGKK